MKSEMESCGVASAGGGEEVDLERMGRNWEELIERCSG